jgi:hypothetical protein
MAPQAAVEVTLWIIRVYLQRTMTPIVSLMDCKAHAYAIVAARTIDLAKRLQVEDSFARLAM